MRKILSLVLLVFITTFMTGCDTLTTDPIEQEYHRLSSFIPKSYNEDFLLPESSENYQVEYYIDDTQVENKVEYILTPNDIYYTLRIEITFEDRTEEYEISITSEGNEILFNQSEVDAFFYNAFQLIEYSIPPVLTSNFTIPEYEFSDYVLYNVDCTNIERDRIVYTYPIIDEECTLTASIHYAGEVRTKEISFVMSSLQNLPRLPEVHIYTTEAIDSKEFETATISVIPNGNEEFKPLNDLAAQIRLRGNSTLWLPKKSYKIKFDESTKFLSQYAERDWVLLANYIDQTLIRNALAYTFSASTRLEFTPTVVFVDVFVNGEYQGNYLLTDQVEVTNDRVQIEENVPAINTGYLIEYDSTIYNFGGIESSDDAYFVIDGMPFKLHSPEAGDAHFMQGHVDYIEQYFLDTIDCLESRCDYNQYIDEVSFVDYYIVNEIFKNVDVWYGSDYFTKEKDGLLKMGPVWDLDLSSGNPGYDGQRGPEGFYTQNKHLFYGLLFQYPEFRQAVKDRWNELYDGAIPNILTNVHRFSDQLTYSQYQNFLLWDVIGKDNNWYTAPELLAIDTYDGLVWALYDWLDERIEWLNEAINDLD